MSDWDQNELLDKIDPEEFLRRMEREVNLQYRQDKEVAVQNKLNEKFLFERGFRARPDVAHEISHILTKNKPWIQCFLQPNGNIIYKMI